MKELPISNGLYYTLLAVGILLSAVIINKILRVILRKYFENASKLILTNPTNYRFFQNAISSVIFGLAIFLIFYLIPQLKDLGITLFASAGIFAAILGFASQQAFSNIIGGIFIVIFKPFKVGDIVEVGTNIRGYIEDINLRHTVIRTFEFRRFIIPNSQMSSDVILNSSYGDERICKFIELGISYDSDVDLARKIIQEEIEKNPLNIEGRNAEELDAGEDRVKVRMLRYGESSIDLRAYAWADNHLDGFVLQCEALEAIKKRFDKEGIEIPFPYRTLVFKNQADVKVTDNADND